MTSPSSVGERVRILRLAANINQADLVRAVTGTDEPSNKLVSQIENGRRPVDPDILSVLAAALKCTPEFLTRPRHDAVSTRPWLRAYADANAKTVDSVLADDMLVHETISELRLKQIPDQIPLFHEDLSDPYAIEQFAEEVRAAADVPDDGVVGNAMRAADRLGCVVLPLNSELGRHLGLSHRINGVPFVRVSRPGAGSGGVPGDRQRFTVAHEIGHLALHSHRPPPDSAADGRLFEQQANRFASAFLAPAHPLIEDWERLGGRVTLSALTELKSIWGVAVKALVVRFQQLGVIDADQATSLYKQISKRGWTKTEPVPVTTEEPKWFALALQQQARASSAPRNALSGPSFAASALGLDGQLIGRWLDWTPVSDVRGTLTTVPQRTERSVTATPAGRPSAPSQCGTVSNVVSFHGRRRSEPS